MPNGSAKVEQETTAQANNSAIPESSLSPKCVFESCRENKTKPHGFSKTVAMQIKGKQKAGWSAAIILRYLSYTARENGRNYDGQLWVRINLDHISARYPYISRSGVDKAISRLIALGACEVGNWNVADGRPSYDRTRWYSIPKKWQGMAEEEIRYFYPPLAVLVGVPAAVIHYNFTHWIAEIEANGEVPVFRLQPATLAVLQPFSKATIKRAIGSLVDGGLLVSVPNERCLYAGSKVDDISSEVNKDDSEVNKDGSEVNKDGSEVNEVSSKVDNDSSCSSFEVSLKGSSKTEPAAQSQNSSPSAVKQMNESCSVTAVDAADIDRGQNPDKNGAAQSGVENSGGEACSSSPRSSAQFFGEIRSLEELHQINKKNAQFLDSPLDTQVLPLVKSVVDKFFEYFDPVQADELYDTGGPDDVLFAVVPTFVRLFGRAVLETSLPQIIYLGALEAIVGGFLWPRQGNESYSHPFRTYIRIAYEIHLSLWQRAKERQVSECEAEFIERSREYASPDERLEYRDDLSPAEKTRVFKQGLHSRNKVGGVHYDGQLRTNEIIILKDALLCVKHIFEANPHATAGDLLAVMDRCLKVSRKQPAPKEFRRKVLWHARMGVKLNVFTRYFAVILKQVGMEMLFPSSVTRAGESKNYDRELLAA